MRLLTEELFWKDDEESFVVEKIKLIEYSIIYYINTSKTVSVIFNHDGNKKT
jgi:hypothetical protein